MESKMRKMSRGLVGVAFLVVSALGMSVSVPVPAYAEDITVTPIEDDEERDGTTVETLYDAMKYGFLPYETVPEATEPQGVADGEVSNPAPNVEPVPGLEITPETADGDGEVSAAASKADNGMTVKTSKKTVKKTKVAKRKQTVSPIKVAGAVGKVAYKKVAKGSSKRLSVNKKTGKVTVKKGTKKGNYKIRVRVTAAGDETHEKATKTVTCKVAVR